MQVKSLMGKEESGDLVCSDSGRELHKFCSDIKFIEKPGQLGPSVDGKLKLFPAFPVGIADINPCEQGDSPVAVCMKQLHGRRNGPRFIGVHGEDSLPMALVIVETDEWAAVGAGQLLIGFPVVAEREEAIDGILFQTVEI